MLNRARAAWLASLALLFVALLLSSSKAPSVHAHHLCAATGSPFGPFDLEAYEAGDYKTVYARTMELAGFNSLFPELPSFAVPRLEMGDRAAASSQTANPYIPPVLLKAIATLESNWAQADYSVAYGSVGPVLASHDCGYGITQVTTGMQNVSGLPNLDQAMIGGHFAFNIARGARILADKWNLAPEYRPQVGARDPSVIENWYYALWGYNGFAFKNHPLNPDYAWPRAPYDCSSNRSNYPYQELVLGCVASPPLRGGTQLWSPQEVHLPDLSDPAFAGPLKLENWGPCSYNLDCAAMDMPTPNTSHQDLTALTVNRSQVIGSPVLSVSAPSVALEAVPGGASLPASLTVSNAGSGPLVWRLAPSAPWLKVSRVEGVSLGADLGPRSQSFKVYADAAGLPPGTYSGQIAVESLHAAGAPYNIPVTLYVSLNTGSAKTADFSGDGKTDFIYLCCSDYASLWTSQGNGQFSVSTYRPWPGYDMRAGTWQAGDVNGDGRADLVHLCCRDYANVWLSNGDGTFRLSFFRPWPDYGLQSGSWRSGDFNNDGKVDLIHLCCGDYANVWLSNGDGTFRLSFFRPWPDYGLQFGSWQSGDLNGDTRTDLLHLCCRDYANAWLSNGDGTFTVTTFRPWPDYDLQSGSWQSGDLNGDRKTDLVHLCCRDYAHVWLSNGNGTFSVSTFQPWPDYGLQSGSWQRGDLNGDGKADLVHLCCGDYANAWLSNGNGTFSVAFFRPWPGYGLQPGAWQNGDFDGDGRTDLLHLCCHYVHVWRSQGNGSFTVFTFSP